MTNKIIIDLSKKFKKWREGGNKSINLMGDLKG